MQRSNFLPNFKSGWGWGIKSAVNCGAEWCWLTWAELPPSPSLPAGGRLEAPAKAPALLSRLRQGLVSGLQHLPGLCSLLVAKSCQAVCAGHAELSRLLARLALQSPFRVLASPFCSTAARCNPQRCLSAQAPPSSVSSTFHSVQDSHLHHMCGVSPIPYRDPMPGEEGSRFRGERFRDLGSFP